MDEPEKLKIMVGREVLRSVLFSYDPQYTNLRIPNKIPHYWLDQAVISWSEMVLSKDIEIVNTGPSDFKGCLMSSFEGMHAGSLEGAGSLADNAATHGRGMAPFIEFLVLIYKSQILTSTYEEISGNKHPVDAVKEALKVNGLNFFGDNLPDVYFNFLKVYLMGDLFNVPADTFLKS